MTAHTRLACYSEQKLLARYGKRRISMALLRQAMKDGVAFDLQLTSFHDPECGRYTSLPELKTRGINDVYIRFDRDTKTGIIKQ